jgi:hypothetical protein
MNKNMNKRATKCKSATENDTAIRLFIVNIQSDLFLHRCLERQTFGTPRMYTLSPSKSIKGSNLAELQISCVFALFTQWIRVKTHVISDQSVHITHTYCCVSKLSKFGAYLYSRVIGKGRLLVMGSNQILVAPLGRDADEYLYFVNRGYGV